MGDGEQIAGREKYELRETVPDSVWYHPPTETYLAVHEWKSDDSLSTTLITAVAAVSGSGHNELPPLANKVGPDALDQAFEPIELDGQCRRYGRLAFPYSGFLITVHADGEVVIRPQQNDSERE
jgi:hypothetical protein